MPLHRAGTLWKTQSLPQLLLNCGLALAGSALVALCAHVAVPLPWTPVPFTLQPFAVLLVGMVLGPVAGFGALAAYLLEGMAGMPVFTPVGAPGIARLLGPTGGYLLAYPLAAALAGWVPRVAVMRHRYTGYALGGFTALLVVYLCGAAWFGHLLQVSYRTALAGAVTPLALPDAVKELVAPGMAATIQRPVAENNAGDPGSTQGI